MKLKIALMVGLVSLSSLVFAEPQPGAPGMPPPERGMHHMALTDAQIVQIVETSNDSEIAAARMEKNHGKSQEAKDLAVTMMDAHTQNNKDFKMLAKKLKMHPEKTPMSDKIYEESKASADRLAKMKNEDLDRAYVDKQVEMHQHVLNKLDHDLIPQAKNDELKTLLQNTRATVAAHLEHATSVQQSINGQTTKQ